MACAVGRHASAYAIVLLSVAHAVGCSIGLQYSVKHVVDVMTAGLHGPAWTAFTVLAVLIAADKMLWRGDGYVVLRCFVVVTGPLGRDLFHHAGLKDQHRPAKARA